MTHFDFKEWADLYETDPTAFEQRREAALGHLINNAKPEYRQSLEHTMFRIRMIRQKSKSPLQSALESSKLMWESFGKLREQVQTLEQELNPPPLQKDGLRLINPQAKTPHHSAPSQHDMVDQPAAPCPTKASAQIISFKASSKRAH